MVTCSREETVEFRQEQCPEEMQREAILVQISNFGVFMVLDWELNTINTHYGRGERLKLLLRATNLSCGRSSLILEVQLMEGCLLQHKKRTRQRTMHFAMASAPALAITALSQVTLNLVHSRLCTSAHKINLLNNFGQLDNFVRHPDKQNSDRYTKLIVSNCFSSLRPFGNVALLADEISSASVYLQYKTKKRMKAYFRNNLQSEMIVFQPSLI